MKVRQIFDLFRSEVDDAKEPFLWPDADLMEYLNDAENEACRRARLIIDSTNEDICQIAIVAATALYALDPRVIFIRRARMQSRSLPISRGSIRDLDEGAPGWESHTGQVVHFITDY